jgi:molybdopterin synthase sulfur carrier subunit
MSVLEVRCGDLISLLARTAICEKVATSVNVTKDVGGGTHPVQIACGLKISCGVREGMMRVQIRLFATLCRYVGNTAPGIPFEIDVPNNTTVDDLVNRLKLPRKEVKVFFVNGRSRPIEWPLEPGDEVGIFPLVAGG